MGTETKETGWWEPFFNDAIQFIPRDHGVAESLLGISKYLKSDPDEAKRLSLQLEMQLDILRTNPSFDGEKDSTQLKRMLADSTYPESIKNKIIEALK